MSGDPAAGDGEEAAVTAARRWLEDRLSDAPERLGRAVGAALERSRAKGAGEASDGPWDVMARAALRELESVRPEADDRDTAVHLLAADALLTYAFQCAAEEGADLRAMADRWGARGELGEALERARRAASGSSGEEP